MNIVSTATEDFVPHVAALFHSVWTHNPEARLFLLDCGISLPTKTLLERYAEKRKTPLSIIPIDLEILRGLPSKRWHFSSYARLLVAEALPPTCEKALYIDADCIVTTSLQEL